VWSLRLKRRLAALLLLAISFGVPGGSVHAEEGMWTFDNPPLTLLREKYGFTPTAEWLEHLRLASVRFNDGGSGSFVSPGGLVITNHHVAAGPLQKLSTAQNDYVADGFYAGSQHDVLERHRLKSRRFYSQAVATGGDELECVKAVGVGLRRERRVRREFAQGYPRPGNRGAGRIGHRTHDRASELLAGCGGRRTNEKRETEENCPVLQHDVACVFVAPGRLPTARARSISRCGRD
jgi:hypothetical protein